MKLSMYQIERIEELSEAFGDLQFQKVALSAVLDDPQYREPNLTRDQGMTWRKAQRTYRELHQRQKDIREAIADCALQLENI